MFGFASTCINQSRIWQTPRKTTGFETYPSVFKRHEMMTDNLDSIQGILPAELTDDVDDGDGFAGHEPNITFQIKTREQ